METSEVGVWKRVGDAVKRRREDLGLTQEQAAANSDGRVSSSNWRVIEGGQRGNFRRSTVRGICAVLGWTPESIEQILEGGEPTPLGGNLKTAHHGSSPDEQLVALRATWSGLEPDERALVLELARKLAGK